MASRGLVALAPLRGASLGQKATRWSFFPSGMSKPGVPRAPQRRTGSSSRAVAALTRQQKADVMKGVSSQNSTAVARVLDQVASSLRSAVVTHSDFLTPPCQEEVLRVLRKLPEVTAVLSGGYDEAERCRVSFGAADVIEGALGSVERPGQGLRDDDSGASAGADDNDSRTGLAEAVAVCRVEGSFRGAKVSHGDFLGAVLGTGITREKVGDIVLLEEVDTDTGAQVLKGAHVVVAPELQDYILTSLTGVHNVDVQVTAVSPSELQARPQRVTQLRTHEASLRLDAVGSAGFRLSRSKFSDLISSGKVRLNWRDDIKGGNVVKTGDVISVRGMGRCKVGVIEVTKKGRHAVEITRYQ